MQKNAYQYLFQEDTLFSVVEPEPLVVPTLPQPVSVAVLPVIELPELEPEPLVAPVWAPIQPEPVAIEPTPVASPVPVPIQVEPVIPEPKPVLPIQVTPEPPVLAAPQLNHKILILVDEELAPS